MPANPSPPPPKRLAPATTALELGSLADLALDTFRHILSDVQAPASVRLKAAMEIVKLGETQRPSVRETTIAEVQFDRIDRDPQLHHVALASTPVRKAQTSDATGR